LTISIDQFCTGFASGDAISNEALILQKYLRESGFQSEIYAEQFPEWDAARVKHVRKYSPSRNSVLVYHHSIDTGFLSRLPALACKKILLYHNVTPAQYVIPYNRAFAERLEHARHSLIELKDSFDAVLADSLYNAQDLGQMQYENVRVMPVAMQPIWEDRSAPERGLGPTVLFVGRVFPNKRHQDLLKAFYFLQKIKPGARLLLVGSFHPEMRGYTGELKNLMRELDLHDVEFTGMVPSERVTQAYREADVFLSMSEHEGFFVPLVESMHFDLPILAYNASVIPETLGESGVLFNKKDFPAVAEMILELHENRELRSSVVEQQRLRRKEFSPEVTFQIFRETLASLGI